MGDLNNDVRDSISVTLELTNQTLADLESDIANLKRNLNDLERRADKLTEFICLGTELLEVDAVEALPQQAVSEILASINGTTNDPIPETSGTGYARQPLPVTPSRQSAAKEAEDLLVEVGHPLSVKEIYEQLKGRGKLHGKAPYEALRTALRDRKRIFKRVGYGIYGLTAWNKSGVA